IKLAAIGATAIIFLQSLAMALTFERPFKAGLSTVVGLRAIANLGSQYWGGQENEYECYKQECCNTDHEDLVLSFASAVIFLFEPAVLCTAGSDYVRERLREERGFATQRSGRGRGAAWI